MNGLFKDRFNRMNFIVTEKRIAYYQNGNEFVSNRDSLPASFWFNDGFIIWRNTLGLGHSDIGPARFCIDGTKIEYWLNGKKVTSFDVMML